MVVEILGELIRTLGMVVIEVAKHEQFNFCMLGNQSLEFCYLLICFLEFCYLLICFRHLHLV